MAAGVGGAGAGLPRPLWAGLTLGCAGDPWKASDTRPAPTPTPGAGVGGRALSGVYARLAEPRAGALLRARLSMTPEEHRAFWRNVQFTVDKDVVRTDRSNQFFRGEDNPNVESMRYAPPPLPTSLPHRHSEGVTLPTCLSVCPGSQGTAAAAASARWGGFLPGSTISTPEAEDH